MAVVPYFFISSFYAKIEKNNHFFMQIIESLTEQTSALTDVFLGITALILVSLSYSYGKKYDKKKGRLWIVVFTSLVSASFLGAIAHGFQMSVGTNLIIWQFLNFSLAIMIAYFALGTLYDLFKYKLSKSVEFIFILIAFAFYLLTVLIPESFLPFVIYEGLIMLFALLAYTYMEFKRKLAGSYWMAFGILLTIFAAIIQATKAVSFTFIVPFDHNGVFHLIQIPGLISIIMGLRKEMVLRK